MFMNDAHNEVNRRLGKHEFSLLEHYAIYRPQDHAIYHHPRCVVPVCIAIISLMAMHLYNTRLKQSRVLRC